MSRISLQTNYLNLENSTSKSLSKDPNVILR